MLPPIRHRLIIFVALVVGAFSWALAETLLLASDGSSGIVLLDACVGSFWGPLVVLGAGLPTLCLALIASAAGNPLAGVFVASGSLCLLAGYGGPIDGWLRRSSLPGGYAWLIAEVVLWGIGFSLLLAGIGRLGPKLRSALPWLEGQPHLGVRTRFRLPGAGAIGAGIVCAAIGAFWTYLTVRTTDGGQVIGSLMMGFAIGAMVAQMCFGQHNPVGILMSPFVVAIIAYGYVMIRIGSSDQVLAAWFSQSLPSSALALPIHYASAAVAGAVMGIGMAQSFDAARAHAADMNRLTHGADDQTHPIG